MELVQALEKVVNNQDGYKFTTDTLSFSTTELKGEKQAYVTGYISVPDVDLYNDVVTKDAMQSMLHQIQESTITIDFEHEAWRDDNSILPVAKITDAKVDDRGLWVKAVLNKNSPKYKALWGSIKEGFINAFSIAFQPLRTVEKAIGDVKVRLIEELKLLNVAFTGAPVNKGAKMTEFGMKSVMLKAIEDSSNTGEQVIVPKRLITKLMEVKNMSEEEIVEEEEVKEEPEVKEEVKAEIEAEVKEIVEEEPKVDEEAEAKAAEEAELKAKEAKVIADLQEMVAKQATELKALKENEVFKSPTPIKPELKTIDKNIDMLGLIN
ncbi:hypothetical protein HN510_03120 [Candidatus Woesearchaeota archaeon]|jgi:HK97 family phage prohead protease|nr:hypothetical protein [Candidatus Woesearchaeota archaeon]